jgi:hypothetical protein
MEEDLMRKIIATALAPIMLFALTTGSAGAVTSKASQRTYFNEQGQVIGESLLYCSGDSRHWGQAVDSNRDGVTVYWNCSDGAVRVDFDIGLPVELRQTFCSRWPVCSQLGPWPVSEQGMNPLLPGLYSQ